MIFYHLDSPRSLSVLTSTLEGRERERAGRIFWPGQDVVFIMFPHVLLARTQPWGPISRSRWLRNIVPN